MRLRAYFYGLLARYVGLYARPEDRLVEVDAPNDELRSAMPTARALRSSDPAFETEVRAADFVLLNGVLHYQKDIQSYLERIRGAISDDARLIVLYYSALWRPFASLATRLSWRGRTPEQNWLAHSDIDNLLYLAGFEVIRRDPKVLFPLQIPLVSGFLNRFLAPLPILSSLCLTNIVVARPAAAARPWTPSVSVIVPARNEAGNIDHIVARTPRMGPDDELVFIEGGSKDDTWERIEGARARGGAPMRIVSARQDGRGKGDAVRKGFALARNEILMILDADLTVPPEDLPKFYGAIVSGKGEFINGSRLVYPMERRAMRFLNLIANKFFAQAFSFVLGQRFKDTLCGTKVISRNHYQRLARHRDYFGEFDPFGDFDLIFGAARMGLRIVEIPITYRERTYGETNISRWRHGALLIAMLAFAARRLKFI
jgi:Glycosyl transferase family 2